jgi:two-component system OmpR family response regulator
MPRGASDRDVVSGGAPAAPPDAHILVCDDDAQLRQLLSAFLGDQGYSIITAGNGRELERVMTGSTPIDLVILDVMLPGQSGRELCGRIRQTSNVPILMLTALGDESDRVVGLEVGADDYMSKPFGPAELLARVKALLRRSRMSGEAAPAARSRAFEFEGWRLDPARRELRNPAGVIIDLSAGEYDLLLAFLGAPQRILSREHLMDAARNRAPSAFDRSIDVQVSRLRRKIGSTDESEGFIKTVRGAGYMFVPAVRRS